MNRIRRKRTSPIPMRNITAYGEVAGTGLLINELEDGATLVVLAPDVSSTQIVLNAENLMKFARELADWFGHDVVHRQEWREKLRATVERVLLENEPRCLDDDVDRGVVVGELLKALTRP